MHAPKYQHIYINNRFTLFKDNQYNRFAGRDRESISTGNNDLIFWTYVHCHLLLCKIVETS